jgi:hypothetical protein
MFDLPDDYHRMPEPPSAIPVVSVVSRSELVRWMNHIAASLDRVVELLGGEPVESSSPSTTNDDLPEGSSDET